VYTWENFKLCVGTYVNEASCLPVREPHRSPARSASQAQESAVETKREGYVNHQLLSLDCLAVSAVAVKSYVISGKVGSCIILR
jgi:hypothetical protein